jgi:hypothetical protein
MVNAGELEALFEGLVGEKEAVQKSKEKERIAERKGRGVCIDRIKS